MVPLLRMEEMNAFFRTFLAECPRLQLIEIQNGRFKYGYGSYGRFSAVSEVLLEVMLAMDEHIPPCVFFRLEVSVDHLWFYLTYLDPFVCVYNTNLAL